MSQIEDVRLKLANNERRIARLESLINPLAGDLQEAASMKAAGAEDLLSEDLPKTPPNTATDGQVGTPDDSDPIAPETPQEPSVFNPEILKAKEAELKSVESFYDAAEKPSVSEELKAEESKDETN